jgi:hypothetical protein
MSLESGIGICKEADTIDSKIVPANEVTFEIFTQELLAKTSVTNCGTVNWSVETTIEAVAAPPKKR